MDKDYSNDPSICKYFVTFRGETTYDFGCVKGFYVPMNDLGHEGQSDICPICRRKIMIFDSKKEEPIYELTRIR